MKHFTVEQANRTLPLVRRIVEDVVREHRRWQEKILELELASTGAGVSVNGQPATPPPLDERAGALERDAMAIARDIEDFERELEELGIVLKDRRLGLIDFPGEVDGRRVWLCWRLGEPAIQYWHDLDAGYAGRQPLPAAAVK
ncbi:MAG: DUF2203 domain-containing protein [Gemmatimonadaceae bacterium]